MVSGPLKKKHILIKSSLIIKIQGRCEKWSSRPNEVFFKSNPMFSLKCLTSLWLTILEMNATCYDDFIFLLLP